AQLHLEAGDADTALPLFERALALDADSAAVHEGLGKVAAARGDDEEAVERFERALALQPEASSLRYLLGQAYRRTGDLERARAELERRGDSPVRIEDPLLTPLGNLAASAQFYIVQGSEALEDDRFEAAAASFARAIEIAPSNFVARKGLGYTLEKLGDATGAEAQLREALEHTEDPGELAEARAILGGLLAALGRDEEAVAELEASLALDAAQRGTRLKLADAQARLGRMREAVAAYDRLLADGLDNPAPVLMRRGTARINLGERQAGLADFRRAVELAPDDAGVRLRYAEALEFTGDRTGAAEQRRRASALAGEGDQQVARLAGEGRLATSRGDYATAVERYREALALAPERHDVRSALAGVLGHLGRLDEALAEYRRVIEAEPGLAAARRGEIAALVLTSRFGQARVRLNEALRRFSRDRELALTQARLLAASPDPRVRDGALAVQVASRVARDDRSLMARDTLAMALAEAGRPNEAAEIQRGVVTEAEAGAPAEYTARLRGRLEAYEAGRPWHAERPEEILAFSGG
ncbi:MAG TPA: tetratricopeptide repeat protein, partial [Thermoanaerobaculia bacterium]|nr:tetratricopeptide repeat protein [Thermoanaerobaculia bacterium]